MKLLIFIVIHWYLSLIVQTLFLHRYASHRMYGLTLFWERVWFLLTFILQGASFLNPAAYAVMHRKHHLKSDTEEDPHSPVYSPNIFHFMLRTFREYRVILDDLNSGKSPYNDLPRWKSLEKFADRYTVRFLFVILYVYIYSLLVTQPWQYSFIFLTIFMGPVHGFIVNWFGHKNGYRNFRLLSDNSRNTLPIDFLMMGELYQNNHHNDPNDPKFSKRWFEFDPGYFLLRIMNSVGLLKLSR